MSRKSIILLHGALGSAQQFILLEKALSPSFDVHSFSFEGHGGVDSSRPFRMNHFVENVLDYMSTHQIETASIFGYSMGGYVALTLASNYPEKVEKIVTLGTKFDWTPEFAAAEVRKLNPEKIEEKVPRFAEYLAKVHAPIDSKKVVNDTAEMMMNLGENKPLTEAIFTSIAQPTLILLGELDNMSTIAESEAVAALLPNGEFKMMERFEHQIEKVDLEVLAGRIGEFV